MNPDNNLQLSYFIQNEIKQTLPWGKPENPYPPVSFQVIGISFDFLFLSSVSPVYYWNSSIHSVRLLNLCRSLVCKRLFLHPFMNSSSSRSRYALSHCWLFQLCFNLMAFALCKIEIPSNSSVTIRSSMTNIVIFSPWLFVFIRHMFNLKRNYFVMLSNNWILVIWHLV